MNLVFIGDSLTEWFDWQKRFPAHRALNLGVSGETVEELLDRCDRICELVKDPDFIFLMTGINNVLMERHEIEAPYREVVRNYAAWWKSAKIAVQSLLPVEMPWIRNDLLRDVNRRLKEIARECGADYLDVYAAFVDTDGRPRSGFLSGDGVHLAPKGYEAWAEVVEKYIVMNSLVK